MEIEPWAARTLSPAWIARGLRDNTRKMNGWRAYQDFHAIAMVARRLGSSVATSHILAAMDSLETGGVIKLRLAGAWVEQSTWRKAKGWCDKLDVWEAAWRLRLQPGEINET